MTKFSVQEDHLPILTARHFLVAFRGAEADRHAAANLHGLVSGFTSSPAKARGEGVGTGGLRVERTMDWISLSFKVVSHGASASKLSSN